MFNPIAVIFCLLITGVYGNVDDNELESSMVDEPDHKESLMWPRIFEILDVCDLSCLGKNCKCCYHVWNVVPVCGIFDIDPTTKMMEVSLAVTGRKAISLYFSINPFLNFCHTTRTDLGDIDLCGNITLSEHKTNPNSFSMCIDVEVQLNKLKHLQVTLKCIEFKGDLIFETDGDIDYGKTIASVKVFNQMVLMNIIRKAVTDNILGFINYAGIYAAMSFEGYEATLHEDNIVVIEDGSVQKDAS